LTRQAATHQQPRSTFWPLLFSNSLFYWVMLLTKSETVITVSYAIQLLFSLGNISNLILIYDDGGMINCFAVPYINQLSALVA
jgi:hypothetical protein